MTKEEYIARIKNLGCFACGTSFDLEIHHWRTRGAGGSDEPDNLICLCSGHHTQGEEAVHRMKPRAFLKRFPHVRKYLERVGWAFEEVNGKFIQWQRGESCEESSSFQESKEVVKQLAPKS